MSVDESLAPGRGRRSSHWKRTVVLSGLIFVAGAASGGFLGRSEQEPIQLQIGRSDTTEPMESDAGRPSSVAGKRSSVHSTSGSGRDVLRSGRKREPRRRAARHWAANVLGVVSAVDARAVQLAWQAPSTSDHVVIVRTHENGRHGVVVFRGRARRVRDASHGLRPCHTYRYTIVSYDRRGRRSTGVPTTVVTGGCT
jgi:hypothetical protein